MPTVISIVSYPFLPAKTGGQKGIALFYKYFSGNCRLICVTTKKNMAAAAEGYEVLNRICNTPFRYVNIFLFFSIYTLIKKEKATHLIIEHPYYGWLGVLLKWTSGIKLVVHSHNIEFQRWKGLGKWWWPVLCLYEKYTHRAADYNFFKTDEDKMNAVARFKLIPVKCTVVTYGIEWNSIPAESERKQSKMRLQQLHYLDPHSTIFLFNGSLDYPPNLLSVKAILEKINPLLMEGDSDYKIIICGKGLPALMNELKEYSKKNIIYAGFVEDISLYCKGADIFINPVSEGGGIQTKSVEALGYNLNIVTTNKGAIGIPLSVTGNKMKVVDDNDWKSFAASMSTTNNLTDIPASFFDHFYWVNITDKAYRFIN
ncbi:MAG: hypothetical protein NVSMB7_13000 [Chitinophagaceae bacterium]